MIKPSRFRPSLPVQISAVVDTIGLVMWLVHV